MVDDRAPFVLTLALTLLGLGVILYGVLLNYGASINGPMIVGGVLMLLGIGVLTRWVIVLDERASDAEGHA